MPGSNGPYACFEAEMFLEAVGLSARGALVLMLFYLGACARSFGGKTKPDIIIVHISFFTK